MTDVWVRERWIFDMRTDLLHYSMRFTLFLYLLIMLTRQRQIKCQSVCSPESVSLVQWIAKELDKVNCDTMLYTPTLEDHKNCSRSTLMCFALEVNVLTVEIQIANKSQSVKLLRILDKLKHKLQDNMDPCPVCELYREESAETFLGSLLNVLHWMNTNRTCAPRIKRHLENVTKRKH
ncbi:interleukin 15, like isoform X2 [Labeo rohita]|uniref:interleukin 15, like isoform X2 n=1 Tax=Labeo rohita TaxID=84645 RepID=UPI0021E294BF|nr:interleukin 15, like isoform X2 [Labeo rohita]